MNVTGKTMIFRHENDGRVSYSRGISWKPFVNGSEEDRWVTIYEPVRFVGGADIPNKTRIEVISSFESGFEKRDGTKSKCLVIKEYKIADNEELNQIDDEFFF